LAAPHPSVARIASVARALGDLANEVVFIGGAIAPLLQTHPVLSRVRPTDDVDAIIASTHYASYNVLEVRLRRLGFKSETTQVHVHRWRAPDGILFDLVPAGDHLGGTGGECDRVALETAITTELEPGLRIKQASAPGFLALKWAAFSDRGETDPFRSEDLEDILALLVSRDSIVAEILASPDKLRQRIQDGLSWLRKNPDYEDLVAASLGNVPGFSAIVAMLNERIGKILSQ
jgi:predicted nucleotidyltransferase